MGRKEIESIKGVKELWSKEVRPNAFPLGIARNSSNPMYLRRYLRILEELDKPRKIEDLGEAKRQETIM